MFINTSLFSASVKYRLVFNYEQLTETLTLDSGRKEQYYWQNYSWQRNYFQSFSYLEIGTSSKCSFLGFVSCLKLSTSPDRPMPSSAVPYCPAGPFCNRSKSSNKAKFFFNPQTPESPIFDKELNKGEERKKNLKHM